MNVLPNCGKLQIRESPLEGMGVFATEDIQAGTILEEVPFILFPRLNSLTKSIYDTMKSNNFINPKEVFYENLKDNLGFKDPERYYFKWSPKNKLDNDTVYTVLPLGFGPIYNSSNSENNASWTVNETTFIFSATRDIKKDEEIKTFYGYFLAENGEIFNCERAFYLALDIFPCDIGDVTKSHKVMSLRFGSPESLEAQRTNPAAHKINALIRSSKNGLTIRSISLLGPSSSVIVKNDIPLNATLSYVYRRLQEASHHPCPSISINFAFNTKDSEYVHEESVVWNK